MHKMLKFKQLFNKRLSVIGMIHVGALPGTPCYEGSVSKLIDRACEEAEIYQSCHIDGVLVENMHDIPYIQASELQPETVAFMTRLCTEVRKILAASIPCGVQVLAGGNKEALAVAAASRLQFIRAEGFVFGHVADEGYIDACAGSLLRYRKHIGAQDVLVFTDIKKKHSAHAVTSDVSIEETAKAAEFFLSDGVIVTGSATGQPADCSELQRVRDSVRLPVLVGSGASLRNLHQYAQHADAVIVGTNIKTNGRWQNPVEKSRVAAFLEESNKI
ncbi:hypothetical protein B566_EDAN006963 [Ephemera danica]|nr:hypothetical protein B566_EDAN006963 [Ephemera danica]